MNITDITVKCQKCTKETHHNVLMKVERTLPIDVMKSLHILGEMYTAKCERCKSEVVIGIDKSELESLF